MFGITKIIATLTFFNLAQCDLIGFNRLGNNIHSHREHTGQADVVPSYVSQLVQAYLLKDKREVSAGDMATLAKMMKQNRRRKVRNNRRFRHYNRMMHKK